MTLAGTNRAAAAATVPAPRWRLRRWWLLAAAGLVLTAAAGGYWFWRGEERDERFGTALAALDADDLDVARRYALELRSEPGHEEEALFLRGAILLRRGYYYPAIDDLQRIEDDSPLYLSALVLVGRAWYHLGRHLEAQAALHKVLEADPEAVDAHRWLGASYYDLGAIHNALFHLEKTGELDPADPRPSRLLGLIYKDYERYDDAVPQYEESLRRKADQADAAEIRQELAACQVKLRRHQAALAILAACQDNAEVLTLRAECHHALGQLSEARQALDAALAAQPDHLEALVLQGTLLLEDGDAQAALRILERTIKLHPQDYTAHFKLAQAYAQAGKTKEAAAEQATTERIRQVRLEFAELHQQAWNRPRDAAIRLRLAELAVALGRPDLADGWVKSAQALQPLAAPTSPEPESRESPRSE